MQSFIRTLSLCVVAVALSAASVSGARTFDKYSPEAVQAQEKVTRVVQGACSRSELNRAASLGFFSYVAWNGAQLEDGWRNAVVSLHPGMQNKTISRTCLRNLIYAMAYVRGVVLLMPEDGGEDIVVPLVEASRAPRQFSLPPIPNPIWTTPSPVVEGIDAMMPTAPGWHP